MGMIIRRNPAVSRSWIEPITALVQRLVILTPSRIVNTVMCRITKLSGLILKIMWTTVSL
jgi:hypothetical protein